MLWFFYQLFQRLENPCSFLFFRKTDLQGRGTNLFQDSRSNQGFIAKHQKDFFANIFAREICQLLNLIVLQRDQDIGPVAGALDWARFFEWRNHQRRLGRNVAELGKCFCVNESRALNLLLAHNIKRQCRFLIRRPHRTGKE